MKRMLPREVIISGREVPIATIVSPMRSLLIPKYFPMFEASSMK